MSCIWVYGLVFIVFIKGWSLSSIQLLKSLTEVLFKQSNGDFEDASRVAAIDKEKPEKFRLIFL